MMTKANPDRIQVHVDLMKKVEESYKEHNRKYDEANAAIKNNPDGYYHTPGGIEPIDFIRSLGILIPFCVGNIIKYVSRYDKKGGVEDLKKAKTYLNWLIDEVEGE